MIRPAETPTRRAAVGLFAGIGGLERGIERAGFETTLLCEVDPAAAAVLGARFPKVPLARDVRHLDALPEDTELLTAGFPCQDLSQAGRTRGISGDKSGLVSHVFRLLEKTPVPWILIENVPFMLQLERGRAMDYMATEFERLGYRFAWRVIDSRAFGLPQRRERVYFVASNVDDPARFLFADDAGAPVPPRHHGLACGFYWTEGTRGLGWAVDAVPTLKGGSTVGIASPPAVWLPTGGIVTPDIRDTERLQGFPADWTRPALEVARRGARWKLVGNAVTPRVAEWVARQIVAARRGAPPEGNPIASPGSWPAAGWGACGRRVAVACSSWPVRRRAKPLLEFLCFPMHPLSHRATTGFTGRLAASRLRYPPEFMEALLAHAKAVDPAGAATLR